jgi:hypothetical protein
VNTDYSLLKADHETFQTSTFAGVIRDIIEKLEIPDEKNCSIFIQTDSSNPDRVGLFCRDLDIQRLCPGTPDYGIYFLTREAHEVYDADVNDKAVQEDLNRMQEFLFLIKKAVA